MSTDLVFVCGSNKALEVHDMNMERCVRTIPNAHSRAVHCICQSKVCLHAYIVGGVRTGTVFPDQMPQCWLLTLLIPGLVLRVESTWAATIATVVQSLNVCLSQMNPRAMALVGMLSIYLEFIRVSVIKLMMPGS